jgi:myo-inositol-1(or 4)-monophosphatase
VTDGVAAKNDEPSLALLTALAVKAAKSAGELLLHRPEALDITTKSSATDVVTHMDHESEALITSLIAGERPGDGLLGEEGANVASSTGVTWVIDPIDGTVNYLYDLPGWSISIAAADEQGRGLVGVVYVPKLGEMYRAERGGGAFCNDQPISVSGESALDRALIATGFGYDAVRRGRQGQVVAGLLPQIRDIRRLGTASVDLCHVARGRVDGYFEVGLKAWDLAAGELIAREAGALVTGFEGERAGEGGVLAAPPEIHGQLREALRGLGVVEVSI